jgi:hypothetical protein
MQRHYSAAPARIEALESRQLFSVSPASLGSEALLHKAASHSHAHSTIPVLTGAAFTGMATSNTGDQPSALKLTITSESKSGALVGTLLVDVGSNNQKTYSIKGSVNHNGAFVLHATGSNHNTALLNGNVSADGHTLAGHYVAHEPGHHGGSGTFTLSR